MDIQQSDRVKSVSLSIEEHIECAEYARKIGIEYGCTIFDKDI